MSRQRRLITITAMAHFLTHLYMLIFPAIIFPFCREFDLELSDVFPLGFMMYLLYGALALPAGYLADRWSRLGILRVCMGGMAIASLLAGFSHSASAFSFALALIGLFASLFHPAGLGLISHEITRQGSGHGVNGIFGNLGLVTAPLFAGAALLLGDWRTAYIGAGLLGLGGLTVSYMLMPSYRPKEYEGDHKKAPHGSGAVRPFLILCAAMTIAGLTYRANMTALPTYFEMNAATLLDLAESVLPGADPDGRSGAAALLVASIFIFSMAGQFFGGKVADRFELREAYFIFHLGSLPFMLCMYFAAGIPLYIAAAGHVFFALGLQPVENSLLSRFIPPSLISTGYGVKFTLSFGVGSLAVWQVAMVERLWGLDWLYLALALQISLILILVYALFRATATERITI